MYSEYHQAWACQSPKQELGYGIGSTKLGVRTQEAGNHSHSSIWVVQEPPQGPRGPRETGWGLTVWVWWKVLELPKLMLSKWGGGKLSRNSNIFPAFCKIIMREGEEEWKGKHFLFLSQQLNRVIKSTWTTSRAGKMSCSPLPLGSPSTSHCSLLFKRA